MKPKQMRLVTTLSTIMSIFILSVICVLIIDYSNTNENNYEYWAACNNKFYHFTNFTDDTFVMEVIAFENMSGTHEITFNNTSYAWVQTPRNLYISIRLPDVEEGIYVMEYPDESTISSNSREW